LSAAGLLFGVAFSIESKKQIDKNVFYISPVVNSEEYYFSLSDIESLQNNSYEPINVSFEILKKERTALGNIEAETKLIITNPEYFKLNNIQFVSGGPWMENMKTERVAVVSEALAWKLFGSTNVSGEQIRMRDRNYLIIGVVRQVDFKTDNYYVWTPALPGMDGKTITEAGVNKIFISCESYSPLDSYIAVESSITSLNKPCKDYLITDMNRYAQSFELRYRLLAFALGAWFIYDIIIRTGRVLKSLTPDKFEWQPMLLAALINIVVIILVAYHMSFGFWFPKFTNNLITGIGQAFFNIGSLPAKERLSGGILGLHQLNVYANAAFGIGIFGLLNTMLLCKRRLPQ